jgi:Mg-chelatase subunit ChlD
MGAFVLAPAFGGNEAPMRALLPLRPSPQDENDGARGPGPGTPPPASESPPPPRQPEDEPPAGETTRASGVSDDPIEVDKRAIALVLVVDRSGSMGNTLPNGYSKMSYAKTSAVKTALALGPGDTVGLVTFGDKDAGRVELPLTDATDIASVRGGIAKLAHGPERTFLLSGMRAARQLIARSNAAVKHIVVITDGEFDVSEGVALQEEARRMRESDRATLSVVSIVDRFTETSFKREAERLTRSGGGQFLPVEDATSVPVLVSAEVTRALQRVGREPREDTGGDEPPPEIAEPAKPPEPREDTPAPPPTGARVAVRHVAESGLLAPIPDGAWPTLGSATPGTAPLDAQVLLVAGDAGWPLLAFGNRGLGRVGAFGSDLFGAAGQEFRAGDGFAARFAQWVQTVLPAEPARTPLALLTEVTVDPPAPTPRDIAALTALAGDAPVVGERPAALPIVRRDVESAVPPWALACLLALLALAVCERFLGPWRGV